MTTKVLVAHEVDISSELNAAFKEGFAPSPNALPHAINPAGDLSITVTDENFPEFAKDTISPWFVLSTSLAHVNDIIERQDDRGYRLFFPPVHKPSAEEDLMAKNNPQHTKVVLFFCKESIGPGTDNTGKVGFYEENSVVDSTPVVEEANQDNFAPPVIAGDPEPPKPEDTSAPIAELDTFSQSQSSSVTADEPMNQSSTSSTDYDIAAAPSDE